MAIIIFLAFSLLLQGALGELVCDELPASMCSFSVSSSGKRCTLETGDRPGVFQCKTSEVVVSNLREHIETDECINACGADRNVIGISSDSLLDPDFVANICSKLCLNNCPNIVDLYSNLALAEGVFLPGICKTQQSGPRREMSQNIRSSGVASADLLHSNKIASAPFVAVGPISSKAAAAVAPASPPAWLP